MKIPHDPLHRNKNGLLKKDDRLFDVYRENFAFISPYIFCFIWDSYTYAEQTNSVVNG